MHEGDLAAGAIVLSFQHTLTQGSLMVQGRPESALYTAVKWRREDFIQEWWALAAEMHQYEARVAAVFLHDQEVINLLEESLFHVWHFEPFQRLTLKLTGVVHCSMFYKFTKVPGRIDLKQQFILSIPVINR